jgi:uncharacterized membrane protein
VSTFVNTLHVLAAVLLIGPLVLAPFLGQRAIRRRSEDGVRAAANQLLRFGAGSVLVAGLGVGAVFADDEWTMATPWVLIASTLYVVALGLIGFYAIPALRKASNLVAEATAEPAEVPAGTDTEVHPVPHTAEKLHTISARVAGAGWLLLVAFAAITILMAVRPFE